MSVEEFIIAVYCWVDDTFSDLLKGQRLRERGFNPSLSDPEVITMELIGEFFGMDEDTHIWRYFREHWCHYFPGIGSRSQFSKQAANLWAIKQQLQKQVTLALGTVADPLHIVDAFPLPVSHFKRAKNCSRFKEEADYGYCASKGETYYGFKGHLIIDFHGAISGFVLTPASGSEREATRELTEPVTNGILLGDKGYLGTEFKADLLELKALQLETPVRGNMIDPLPKYWRSLLNRLRRRVETTIGQLVERFNIQRTKGRTLWSLTNRITRKLLSHSLCVLFNRIQGNTPLQLAKLIG
ncbi:IS982 family transposase [Zooshikella marina]|uniref:IS982 family transposase n=1 Tax=Zooshikella ganghwensis TaxID=202772 RepID=UPI001BAEB68A|nr:IS982 family transposase [Zooshikella ganghwensis]MBU2708802.1 IS982 family transposase [Zooshikella ganghwensis]